MIVMDSPLNHLYIACSVDIPVFAMISLMESACLYQSPDVGTGLLHVDEDIHTFGGPASHIQLFHNMHHLFRFYYCNDCSTTVYTKQVALCTKLTV